MRGSTPRVPLSGKLVSKVPELPCVIRDTRLVSIGGAMATVNGKATNAAQVAPGGKLSTQTWNAPGCVTCAAVTGTLSCVLSTKFTVGNAPFTETTELGVKPVPLRVSMNPGLPATINAGLT